MFVILVCGMVGAVASGNKPLSEFQSETRTTAAESSAHAICSVRREIYIASPKPGVSPVVGVRYLGKGLRRREILGEQGKSDLAEKMKVRFSDDNGRTWSPLAELGTGPDALRQGEIYREDLSFAVNFDPTSRRTIEMVFQRIFLGEPSDVLHSYWKGEKKFYDHMMYRLSADDGRTWTTQRPLRYEAGADL